MSVSYFFIHKDAAKEWRWRFVATNAKIIAVGSESHQNLADCEHSIALIKTESIEAPAIGDEDYKKLQK